MYKHIICANTHVHISVYIHMPAHMHIDIHGNPLTQVFGYCQKCCACEHDRLLLPKTPATMTTNSKPVAKP